MESAILGQQISQRASDVDRLSGLMNSAKNEYFDDWRSKAGDLYQKKTR